MGLFKKKEKSREPIKPLNEYLNQRDGTTLFNEAKRMMRPSLTFGLYMLTSKDIGYLSSSFLNGDGNPIVSDDIFEPIPKAYYKTEIKLTTLLELAQQKGVPEAAFVLAVLYDHGIGVEVNHETAGEYYDRARFIPSENNKTKLYVDAMNYIKLHTMVSETYTDDRYEDVAMSITFLSLCYKNLQSNYKPILEIFSGDKNLLNGFLQLGYFLLCHYAKKKNPYSLLYLGRYMNNGAPEIFNVFDHSESKIKKVGLKFIEECVIMAQCGDKKACSLLDDSGVKYNF